jgi:hypothetical protein
MIMARIGADGGIFTAGAVVALLGSSSKPKNLVTALSGKRGHGELKNYKNFVSEVGLDLTFHIAFIFLRHVPSQKKWVLIGATAICAPALALCASAYLISSVADPS